MEADCISVNVRVGENTKRGISVLLVLAALTGCATGTNRDHASIDVVIERALAERSVPGVTVAIASGGHLLLNRAYGKASLDTGDKVSTQTTFRLGSISKFFTALAIMRLAEEGRVQLDQPVVDALRGRPGIEHLPPSVTVAMLLNHTSGIGDHTEAELVSLVESGTTDPDYAQVLERPLLHEPGEGWFYSNVPYRLLTWLVEQASGQSFGDYVRNEMARRLGLRSLRSCDSLNSRQATGYLSQDADFRPEAAYSIRGLLGEGGLCASATDLALLPRALLDARWISTTTLQKMIAPTRLKNGVAIDYGFGVRRGLLGSESMWGHTGSGLHGGWAAFAYYPARDTTIVVLANGSGGPDDAITLQAKVAVALFRQAPPLEVPISDHVANQIAGAYVRTRTLCVERSPEGIFRRLAGSDRPPVRLLHQGQAVFARADYPQDRLVFQTDNRVVSALSVYYDGFFAEVWRPAQSSECAK